MKPLRKSLSADSGDSDDEYESYPEELRTLISDYETLKGQSNDNKQTALLEMECQIARRTLELMRSKTKSFKRDVWAMTVSVAVRMCESLQERHHMFSLQKENIRKDTVIQQLRTRNRHLEAEVSGFVKDLERRLPPEPRRTRADKKRSLDEAKYVWLTLIWIRLLISISSFTDDATATRESKRRAHNSLCVRCYQNGLPCDDRQTCGYCLRANLLCKRTKCSHYKTGQCIRPHCTRAHEEDGFNSKLLMSARHFRKQHTLRALNVSQNRGAKSDPKNDEGSGPEDDTGSDPEEEGLPLEN
jgi:hypothetical protein